jgi:hypothetical protein
MTLAITIGASTASYSNIDAAYAMAVASRQKLAISGTGQEIKDALTVADARTGKVLNDYAASIGSIKASSDVVLNADQVTASKSVLLKLGTRSLVLQSASETGGLETAVEVKQNYQALDATYTKFKAMNIASAASVAVTDLAASVNLSGIEKLSGRVFDVTGSASDIKLNMTSLLRNVASIGKLVITGGTQVQFNLAQLKTLGDKLDTTSSTGAAVTIDGTAATTANVITIASHGLITGDKVTLTSTAGVPAAGTYTKYVRALTTGTFALYDTAENATGTGTTGRLTTDNALRGSYAKQSTVQLLDTADNLLTTSGLATINKYNNTNINAGSIAGDAPIRTTTLHRVDIDNASLNQVNYITALTAPNGVTTAGLANRTVSNIISVVGIKDSETNLMAGDKTTTFDAATAISGNVFTTATHNLSTGDAVYYTKTAGSTVPGNMTTGTTYYVGKRTATTFVLFDTKANALAADLTSNANAIASTGAILAGTGTAGTGAADKLSTSTLFNAMKSVAAFNGNTGTAARVTIAGNGATTAANIANITAKAVLGNANAQLTYAAKAIDIQKNIQALYDNNVAGVGTTPLTEIVVTDGNTISKKSIVLSMLQYSQLKDEFSNGVTNPLGDSTAPTNYAFTVTGAAFSDSPKAGLNSLQNDKNVASFFLTNVSKASILTLDDLRDMLSQSKMKTATTESQSANSWSVAEKANLATLTKQISSGVDKAKLKITV